MAHDLQPRPVLLAGCAIACTVLLAVAAVLLLLRHWGVSARVDPSQPAVTIPFPPLESAPQEDMKAYRTEKQRTLDGVGWVDTQPGFAHIPIADAMDLLVQRMGTMRKKGHK